MPQPKRGPRVLPIPLPALLPLLLLSAPCCAQTGTLPLDEVMARLAATPERRATFTEEKTVAALTTPLHYEGRLLFRKPDHLEKVTTAPTPERLVVDGNHLVIDAGGNDPPRVIELDGQPALRALVDTIRDALGGNLPALRRRYDVTATGTTADWQVELRPRDGAVAQLVAAVRLAGGSDLRSIETVAPGGDTDTLTVTAQP